MKSIFFINSFSLHKMLLMDWSGVDYLLIIVMFLSAVWTLILTAPIHCRASIGEQVMLCYISPNLFWWRINSFTSRMAWGWENLRTIPLNKLPFCSLTKLPKTFVKNTFIMWAERQLLQLEMFFAHIEWHVRVVQSLCTLVKTFPARIQQQQCNEAESRLRLTRSLL